MLTVSLPSFYILRRENTQYLVLLAATALAVGIRLYHLGEWSFWVDELNTLDNAVRVWESMWVTPKEHLLHHPVTSFLVYQATQLLGLSEWSARVAPVLIGASSIPVLYFLTRRALGINVALVVVLLLAISPWHLYWSQNARFYVTLLLFYTVALFLFHIGLEEDRPFLFVAFSGLVFLTASERLLGLFLLPVVFTYLIALKLFRFDLPVGFNKRNLALISVLSAMVFLFIGWLSYTGMSVGDNFSEAPPNNPLNIAMQTLRGVDIPVFLLGGGTAVYYFFFRRDRSVLLFTLAAIVPLVVVMAASLVTFTNGRYTFIGLTGWLVLAAIGITTYLSTISDEKIRLMTVFIVALLFTLGPVEEIRDYFFKLNGGRPKWEEAFEFVTWQKRPSEQIITNDPKVANFYLGEEVTGMREIVPDNDPARLVQSEERIWFVVAGDSRIAPQLAKWMKENTDVAYYDGQRTWVYVYDPG